MIHDVLDYRLDLWAFTVLLWVSALAVHVRLRWRYKTRGVSAIAWLFLAATLVVGSLATEWAGTREQTRLRDMLDGIAPTYAQELSLMGHQRITLDTRADDPLYLSMIEAEKRWQQVNPNVNDVYTFRKRPDGKIVLVVDSETDYDHNGKIDAERERRTPIGEEYAADEALIHAFAEGEASFDGIPYTDRWGTWVSAYAPMFDEHGHLEAILGVDYDASKWATSIEWARASTLGFTALVAMAVLTATSVISVTGAELERRTAAEKALRVSEGRLRTILDTEPEWVQVVDREGRITEINPAGAAILGASDAKHVVGTSLNDHVIDEHRGQFERLRVTCLAGAAAELRFAIDVGGTRRWLDAHAVPLRDADGQISAILSVLRDITAQKEAEDERERLQRQLVDASRQAGMAEVATGVLHNVGNVLNSVNVSAGVITERLQRSKVAALRKAAGMIRDNRADLAGFLTADPKGRLLPDYFIQLAELMTAEQQEMTQELTTLSSSVEHIKRIVGAQQAYAKHYNTDETFEMPAILDDALRMNALSIDRHGIEIVRKFAPCLAVTADRHKVLQIVVNLVSNAKKAVCRDGATAKRITLSLSDAMSIDGRAVARIAVSDSGVGIAPTELSKIFTHGYTTSAEGHGFGLHFCAIAAKQMNGSLSVNSDGVGKGATFVLEIPFERPPQAEQKVEAEAKCQA